MKQKMFIVTLILSGLVVLLISQPYLFARDNPADSLHKRPAPEFDHILHEEALDNTGCSACHHILDETSNKLIYSEGEEANCSECHAETAVKRVLALREANHASCTACHRELIKQKKSAGPTTCGECHKK